MTNYTTINTDLISFSEFQQFLFRPLLPIMGYPLEKTKGECAYFFKDATKHNLPQQNFSTKHHWFYMNQKRKHQNKRGDRHVPISCPTSPSLAHLKNDEV